VLRQLAATSGLIAGRAPYAECRDMSHILNDPDFMTLFELKPISCLGGVFILSDDKQLAGLSHLVANSYCEGVAGPLAQELHFHKNQDGVRSRFNDGVPPAAGRFLRNLTRTRRHCDPCARSLRLFSDSAVCARFVAWQAPGRRANGFDSGAWLALGRELGLQDSDSLNF